MVSKAAEKLKSCKDGYTTPILGPPEVSIGVTNASWYYNRTWISPEKGLDNLLSPGT